MARTAWVHPVFFVDPSDVSGHANDNNNGLTATSPIMSTGELNKRLFERDVQVASVINYMSDDPKNEGLDLSTTSIGLAAPGSLTFQGTVQIAHTGGILDPGTVDINPMAAGGGQRQTAHTTDITDFGPYVVTELNGTSNYPERLVDTVTDNGAWIVSGSSTASMSRPVNAAGTGVGPITVGNAYKIQRGSLLSLAYGAVTIGNGTLAFNDFTFDANSTGPRVFDSISPTVSYLRCGFLAPLVVGGVFTDCYLTSGMQGCFIATILAGVLLTNPNDDQSGNVMFSADTYVTGGSIFQCGQGFYQNIFIEGDQLGLGYNDNGLQVQDLTVVDQGDLPGLWLQQGGSLSIYSLLWGNGNADVGLLIEAGTAIVLSGFVVPNITGVNGDFAFNGGGVTERHTAQAWNGTAFTAPIACTWANFSTPIASGGLGGNAHDQVGSAVVMMG